MTRAAAWALVLLLLVPAVRAQQAAPAERLREVEEQRGRAELFLRQVEEKRAAVLEVLEQVEREAQEAGRAATQAAAAAVEAKARHEAALARERTVEEERTALARRMGPRLTLRDRMRGTGYFAALVSAPSIGDYLWRQRMLDRVLMRDLELAGELAAVRLAAVAAREQVEREQTALAEAERTSRQRASEATDRRAVQTQVLRELLRERAGYEQAVAELERARRGLLEALATLPAPAPGLGGFGARRGRLPWPVQGVVDVAFGRHVDPRFQTVLQQKGVDLRAEPGALVRVPHAASVGYAGWFRGFGNLVVLDHGEGYYTLYAHLADLRVERGDRVEQGDVLGAVGDTASLKGPFLYFEVRSGAKALDPAGWLAKR